MLDDLGHLAELLRPVWHFRHDIDWVFGEMYCGRYGGPRRIAVEHHVGTDHDGPNPQTLNRIIDNQNAHKDCFGTDCTLAGQTGDSDYILSLPILGGQKEGILGETAWQFIGL